MKDPEWFFNRYTEEYKHKKFWMAKQFDYNTNIPYYTEIVGIYLNMKQRCCNKNCKAYSIYGGRGIIICDEWLNTTNGFKNFYEWSMNNGYCPGLSIDRIDNDGNYEPNNCQWISRGRNSSKRSIDSKIKDVEETLKDPLLTPKQKEVFKQSLEKLKNSRVDIIGRLTDKLNAEINESKEKIDTLKHWIKHYTENLQKESKHLEQLNLELEQLKKDGI